MRPTDPRSAETSQPETSHTETSMDISPSTPAPTPTNGASFPLEPATFDGSVVQFIGDDPTAPDVIVETLHDATITISPDGVVATDGQLDWHWGARDIEYVVHGSDAPWTVLVAPGVADFGVAVPAGQLDDFRSALARLQGIDVRHQRRNREADRDFGAEDRSDDATTAELAAIAAEVEPTLVLAGVSAGATGATDRQRPVKAVARGRGGLFRRREVQSVDELAPDGAGSVAALDAREISAWFGTHQVLDRVSLMMPAGKVTALIGPSGCGKSTFLRILNRMHEMIPSASMAGEVMLDGHDVYDPSRKLTDARREIGMVFQKPNPFPAMSIYDNVIASLRVTGVKASTTVKDDLVESCLAKAGLWNEVKDRLRQPGGGLSGGQQQRLCIARALAIKPRVLLMDEPCSALDPTSTRRIEQTIMELASELTIVIVTHNMQQAARVSDRCAFFLAEHGTPGVIVEHGPTTLMFGSPQDQRTNDYVNGRFG